MIFRFKHVWKKNTVTHTHRDSPGVWGLSHFYSSDRKTGVVVVVNPQPPPSSRWSRQPPWRRCVAARCGVNAPERSGRVKRQRGRPTQSRQAYGIVAATKLTKTKTKKKTNPIQKKGLISGNKATSWRHVKDAVPFRCVRCRQRVCPWYIRMLISLSKMKKYTGHKSITTTLD